MGTVVLGRVTEVPRGRVAGWGGLVVALAALGYAGRLTDGAPDRDVLYRYSTAVGTVILFGVVAGVLLVLARDLALADVLALRLPRSPWRALGQSALALGSIWVVALALSPFLNAGKDQGLVPRHWEPSHAGAFAANFVVIVLVAPLIEESVFRGFGISALEPLFGRWIAVGATALAWSLAHGLAAGLPVLIAFGVILGVLRLRTGSVLPGMITHATFNAVTLVLAVSGWVKT
jgi:membrane protease YdiL (CAAX protease family)